VAAVVLQLLLSVVARPSHLNAAELTVAAAADLRFAFAEIGQAFEQETGTTVIFSFGSTGLLAKQIEHGAPFDLFAAANTSFLDKLRDKGLIVDDSRRLYARGRIVLAVNKKTRLHVTQLPDLLQPGIKAIAMANPRHAPYGLAAQQAMEKLGMWDRVRPKLVYGDNIRHTLELIQTGNAEVGVIALSVAKVPEIDWTLIPDDLHAPIDQALAIIKGTKMEAQARRFIHFVNQPAGRLIMKKYGFILPAEF
jgi:molybdate transport system substrate-binding protein